MTKVWPMVCCRGYNGISSHGVISSGRNAREDNGPVARLLLFSGGVDAYSGPSEVRQVLAEGILRVSKYLREIRGEFERSDVNAQLLRVRFAASALTGLPLNEVEAAEEAAAIQEFQIDEPAVSDHGGFWFGSKHGRQLPFINPVSTAFCLQAHQWWLDYQAGRFVPQAII